MGRSTKKADGRGQIIGRVLPTAVRLWLQTQVEQVDSLVIDLEGRDRQLISGYIPGVGILAENVIYKGIKLSRAQLNAEDIQINLGQVVRGKPLRLMQRFPVKGQVVLSGADIATSASSPLLTEGLSEFWRSLVQLPEFARAVDARYGGRSLQPDTRLHRPLIKIGDGCLAFGFYPQSQGQIDEQPIVLATELSLVSGQLLELTSPYWLDDIAMLTDIKQGEPIEALSGFRWDLGADTQLSRLDLQPSRLVCEGQVTVRP